MQFKAIHQFSPSSAAGDGVTNGMIFTRRLLRQMGFQSEIFSEYVPHELKDEIFHSSSIPKQSDFLLLVHHSLGYENAQWLKDWTAPKVLIYHNITPVQLLPEEGPFRRLSALGRQQLTEWAPGYLGAIGDSEGNSTELREAGFARVTTIPLLVDTDLVRTAPWNPRVLEPLRDAVNLLYVGRICENKHQLDLLDVFNELRHFANQPVRLILAGGVTSADYLQKIQARISALALQDQVILAGKVPATTLMALYRAADVFLCMSEHEGFGMPLIEAMLFDVPVVALAASGVPDTMGEGGLLFKKSPPNEVAALLHMVISEPGLRRQIIAGQRRNLQRFTHANLLEKLGGYLSQLGIQMPVPLVIPQRQQLPKYWQIEGPFDSSYSLAIVNRELARALAKSHRNIGLRSMEGGGDFKPSAEFLATNSDCATFVERAISATDAPDVALRFCYPPNVDDMAAQTRVVHSYGWEETGFPANYVSAFNRKLDLITVLSEFVKKVLQDNGVRVPIAVTGAGVDHLLHTAPQMPAVQLRSFRFLHVSSCFPRKGIDVLLRAYGQAFSLEDDVSLVIKTFPNPHNDVAAQLAQHRQANPYYPHVVLVNRDSSDEELVGWYRTCHALVAPSRGEGLGLPMAEAMMFNLPVITTRWGGQLDFCDDTTAWLCDYQFEKSRTHFGATHSAWANPDEAHLAELLREVHRLTPEQRTKRTDVAYQRTKRDFTWERVAQRTEKAIQAVNALPMLRNEPRIGWISTWNKRCGIAAYSGFLAQAITADRLTVFADKTTERTAQDGLNVVRNWKMKSDETVDNLLRDIKARSIEVVIVQYNFAFFSLSTLAQIIQQLKKIGVAVHCFFHSTADLLTAGVTTSLLDIAPTLALADRLYVHSVPDLNRFKNFGLIDNVVFFPQGVPPTPSRSEHAKLTLPGMLVTSKVIATYGFLLPHKGLQQLIKAFAKLASTDSSLHLLMVNALYPAIDSKVELQACEALIKSLNIQSRVTLMTEYLPDAQCVTTLQAADLIVYPYQQTQESSSAAVRTGLATGKPVAVTPLSIFDDVDDAVHRLPGTDPQALADGIRALLDDPLACKAQSQRAAEWVASRQWPVLSVRLMNLLDGLANPLN